MHNRPVLIALHVRANYLERQIEQLKISGVSSLFVSIDGPRDEVDKQRQEEIFVILDKHKLYFTTFEMNIIDKNQGAGVALISALDWFFSKNDSGIIFEDDIIFNQTALEFLDAGLNAIADSKGTLLVSAFNPFSDGTESEAVYSNYPQIWGWASTKEKWQELRSYYYKLPKRNSNTEYLTYAFWKLGWERVSKGFVDAWDIPLAAGMRFENKLCLLPPRNFISNVGWDELSSNTRAEVFPLGLKIAEKPDKWLFPEEPNSLQIKKINHLFDTCIYRVSNKSIFSLITRIFDNLRFRGKKKDLLLTRLATSLEKGFTGSVAPDGKSTVRSPEVT